MGTPFDSIFDLSLASFNDWRLTKIYSTDINSFRKIMTSYLLKAIPKFSNANVDLYNYDLVLAQFNEELDLDTQVILSNFLVLEWFENQINDVRTMSLLLNDTDFKHNSEANMLRQKTETRNQLREMNERALVQYSLKNVDWEKL